MSDTLLSHAIVLETVVLDLSIKTSPLLSIATMDRTADLRALSATGYVSEIDHAGTVSQLSLIRLRLSKQQQQRLLKLVAILADPSSLRPVRTCLFFSGFFHHV